MLERLFQKIFVAIIPLHEGHEVYVSALKNKKLLYKERRHFEGSEPSKGMIHYIQEVIDPSPIFYISTLNKQANQGAYEGCPRNAGSVHGDVVGAKTLCRDKKWTLYASLDELHKLSNRYDEVGLDFVFSPFSLIEQTFSDRINDSFAIYAFAMPGIFSVAIFDKGVLEYAHHYTQGTRSASRSSQEASSLDFTSPVLEDEGDEGLIRLDDIEELEDLDIIDDLDSLSDIADLDELEEVNEFSEDMPTPEEKRFEKEQNALLLKGNIDSSSEDYQRFDYIQKTLHRFYASEQCHNRFVETVCIADSEGQSDELKRYLEEELFLNVLIRKVDVAETINALAMIEEEAL